jgi:hypothetical protein
MRGTKQKKTAILALVVALAASAAASTGLHAPSIQDGTSNTVQAPAGSLTGERVFV